MPCKVDIFCHRWDVLVFSTLSDPCAPSSQGLCYIQLFKAPLKASTAQESLPSSQESDTDQGT